jgi:N-acetylmuramoyl-L-alanine amidase
MRFEDSIRMSVNKLMRWGVCAAGLSCVAATCCGAVRVRADIALVARTRAAKKVVALSPWEQAEQGRDVLEAIAEDSRTRADFGRTMDAYRAIYHANPADSHAAAAVSAVAELLVEQGRLLHDAKSLNAAVGQYEFLRKQYPASSLGAQALLAEGRIEQDDLGDSGLAREKYKLLLREHPKSEQAEEAKAGLASLEVQGSRFEVRGKATEKDVAGSVIGKQTSRAVVDPTLRGTAAKDGAPGGSSLPAMAQTSGVVEPTRSTSSAKLSGTPAHDQTAMNEAAAVVDVAADANGAKRNGKRALVTGIRHWSTATYTRVAIDLGDNVTYEAARVPNPDRIYFDLHGAKLAQELVGKSFTVTDDGFLKKVRAAQYSDDVTRIVLDVNDVTEYSAFLLPNPYRLIIDIHGGKAGPLGTTMGAPQRRAEAAPTVPNTIALKQASSAEVVAVSEMPGKVEATSKPTSKPISAVVENEGPRPEVRGSKGDGSGKLGGGATDIAQAQPAVRDSATKDGPPRAVAAQPTRSDDAAMNGAPRASDGSKKTRKIRGKSAGGSNTVVADATPARAATPMADGETSLVRALGLKIGRIVIDAGHGGHDSGTLGADGIQEKDVVLDVALRLGKLLHDRLGAEIIYTRSDDTFIPLETRTAIANKAQADLFLSIHANSSSDASARGVETYYLNFTSDPTALDVAARENAVSDQSIHQLSDLVKKIALKDKISESREFAADVEGSLYAGLQKGNAGLKDRGVKKAPFVVLIGANMPSILAEISFVTNPKDAEQLQQPEYRERVAESLYKGVSRYEGGLSGTRVATERAAVGQ